MPVGDVWGNSWGDSWNSHWKQASTPPAPTPPPAADAEPPRGTAAWLSDLPRTRKEISKARERFGLTDALAAEAIAEVAARQAERDEQDEQKRFDELFRELELKRIAFDARYLDVLAAMRESFIEERRRAEVARRHQEEEEIIVLLMVATGAVL